jgi:tRNA 2-thiocytidine biosynthesis protein TtcA
LLAALTNLQWRGLLPVDPGLQPRPGAAGLSRDGAARVPDPDGRAAPDRVSDTYSIVTDKVPRGGPIARCVRGCGAGNLYRIAREEGCSAVVLGHHRDDILETFFLNLFHGGGLPRCRRSC